MSALAVCALLGRLPTSSHAVDCHFGEYRELTIRDSDVAAAYLAPEVRDDFANEQLVPDLPLKLYQHLFDASLHERRQQHGLRPNFHEKAMFVNEVGPFRLRGVCRRKVRTHEFVDATWVHQIEIGGRKCMSGVGRKAN
ncbi:MULTISPECIES: hypothetical protein [unclassified Variovorax]|uniref:hypothetical protein n=1 Tax=unclassified Variovorax TaxID=663243 RepID=UPI003F45486B